MQAESAPDSPSPLTEERPIRPRRPELHFPADLPRHWFGGNPVATHVVNAVNLLFPAGERFFVRSVRAYLDEAGDGALRARAQGFFGQEGRHAAAHERYFDALRAQGYRIDRFLAVYQRVAYGFLERISPPALRLSSTAAAEHFTAILADEALGTGLLDRAHPSLRALLQWHAAEEIEHKAVAFDVLGRVSPSYGLRVAGLLMATVVLCSFWLAGTVMLLRQDRLGARGIWRAAGGARGHERILGRVFLRGIRQYLRRGFHPDEVDNYALAQAYLQGAGLEPA